MVLSSQYVKWVTLCVVSLLRIPASDAASAAASYTMADEFVGEGFLKGFQWETIDDPTHGRVNFVDQPTALSSNLTFTSATTFVMRADASSIVPADARGRNSIRIQSYKAYDDAVFVLDLAHMPEGCSTWPAFRTVSQADVQPHPGVVDVIEGVNLQKRDLVSVHTSTKCNMSQISVDHPGHTISSSCDASVNGCTSNITSPLSYGSSFNRAHGGWYAMQKSATAGIKIWFWPRLDTTALARVPKEIRDGAGTVQPDEAEGRWGTPVAQWAPEGDCQYGSYFDQHAILFDLTLCGDWAGSASEWGNSTCGAGSSSCADYVNNNPSAFTEAYWEINSLRVYTSS